MIIKNNNNSNNKALIFMFVSQQTNKPVYIYLIILNQIKFIYSNRNAVEINTQIIFVCIYIDTLYADKSFLI